MPHHNILLAPSGYDFPADDWHVVTIEGSRTPDLKALYAQLAEALEFPDYFAHNLDSLDELLNDLSWLSYSKLRLYFANTEQLLRKEPNTGKVLALIDLFDATAEDWYWMDEEDEEIPKKALSIVFEDSPRIRTLLDEQEIPYELLG